MKTLTRLITNAILVFGIAMGLVLLLGNRDDVAISSAEKAEANFTPADGMNDGLVVDLPGPGAEVVDRPAPRVEKQASEAALIPKRERALVPPVADAARRMAAHFNDYEAEMKQFIQEIDHVALSEESKKGVPAEVLIVTSLYLTNMGKNVYADQNNYFALGNANKSYESRWRGFRAFTNEITENHPDLLQHGSDFAAWLWNLEALLYPQHQGFAETAIYLIDRLDLARLGAQERSPAETFEIASEAAVEEYKATTKDWGKKYAVEATKPPKSLDGKSWRESRGVVEKTEGGTLNVRQGKEWEALNEEEKQASAEALKQLYPYMGPGLKKNTEKKAKKEKDGGANP